jgi:hypothetical protein
MIRHADIGSIVATLAKHPLSRDSCFVCAEPLTEKSRTNEDVIPLWVQQRFGLINQRCNLLNNTDIQYKSLKIPCCNKCNNEHLSQLEKKVQTAVDGGYDATVALPSGYLYQWLAKIYIGLLYKELFLPADRKNPSSGAITTSDHFDNVRILWLWLQLSFTQNTALVSPGSIFIFRCLTPGLKEEQFDVLDDILTDCIAIRLGEVGIVADLLDTGIHKKAVWSFLNKYLKIKLHPFQFRELAVQIFYKASLLDLEIEVTVEEHGAGSGTITIKPKSTSPENSLFRKWDHIEYAHKLSYYTGRPVDQIISGDSVWSWLEDASGNLIDVTRPRES